MVIDPLVMTAAAAGVVAAVTCPALVVARRGRAVLRRELARARAETTAAEEQAQHRVDEAQRQTRTDVERVNRSAREKLRRLDDGARDLLEQLRRAGAETAHLRSARIPAVLQHVHAPHVVVPGLMHQQLAATDLEWNHDAILKDIHRAVMAEGERADEAGLAVVRGVLGRVHRMHLRMQDKITAIQNTYPDADPGLMAALLDLDMANELLGRTVQTPAVACGATSLLFREQTHLPDVVMSAASRVHDFQRRIATPVNHLERRVGVAEQAVEAVRIITSALLANAVEYSHGTLRVETELHETPTGASIVIDDAGVGLTTEQLARARRLLSGERAVRLVDLGDPPRTGWAAIGMLVRQYGMRVSVRKGRHGGVSAVVSLPNALLVEMPQETRPSVLAPEPGRPGRGRRRPARAGGGGGVAGGDPRARG
ncbi:hypothetical protein ACFXP3_39595, partial [Streptomyces sp. NPDC059096]|uniref:hypothetical protein n=1 Tax=Streptomyces sp. NPDC059096 TaxID=3346727 RepID=UPI0036786739